MPDNFSYTKHMLFHKIPRRFLEIVLPEIIISIILFVGHKFGFFPVSFYYVGLLLGLIIYWIITWILVAKDSENTYVIGHCYICNISAFALFLLVAGIIYYAATKDPTLSGTSALLFSLLFRLALASAYLYNDYGTATASDFSISLLIFFGITFIIIMIQPLIQFISETAYARKHFDD